MRNLKISSQSLVREDPESALVSEQPLLEFNLMPRSRQRQIVKFERGKKASPIEKAQLVQK